MSKPGIKIVDGSSAGFHLGGFGGMDLEVDIRKRDSSHVD